MSDARLLVAPVLALVLGVAVPMLFMRFLAPSLERGQRVKNYRGREVFPGLGIVWLVWAGCAIVCGVASSSLEGGSLLQVLTLLGPLALVAFALGVVDDAYGNGEDRGFRGHFRALARGRMTTGMLKLVGVGAASFVVAMILSQIAPWGAGKGALWMSVLGVLFATAAIALTTNFVNLTDLRPGRALKVYSMLVVIGVLLVPGAMRAGGFVVGTGMARAVSETSALLIALLGPVVAVWRFDTGERGMLGDAGANAMGAVAGALIVLGLPLWGLVAYTLVVVVVNALSERVSFSAVIDRTSVLHWFDRLGRLPEDVPADEAGMIDASQGQPGSPSTARPEASGSRYDSTEDTNGRKA